MASSHPVPSREYLETGGEPEFFITNTRFEDAGGGNVRVFAYSLRNGKLHCQFTVVVPAPELATMGRQALMVASEAHNVSQWTDDMTEQ